MKLCNIIIFASIVFLMGSAWKEPQFPAAQRPESIRPAGESLQNHPSYPGRDTFLELLKLIQHNVPKSLRIRCGFELPSVELHATLLGLKRIAGTNPVASPSSPEAQ